MNQDIRFPNHVCSMSTDFAMRLLKKERNSQVSASRGDPQTSARVSCHVCSMSTDIALRLLKIEVNSQVSAASRADPQTSARVSWSSTARAHNLICHLLARGRLKGALRYYNLR